jgi:hypothetical protein
VNIAIKHYGQIKPHRNRLSANSIFIVQLVSLPTKIEGILSERVLPFRESITGFTDGRSAAQWQCNAPRLSAEIFENDRTRVIGLAQAGAVVAGCFWADSRNVFQTRNP